MAKLRITIEYDTDGKTLPEEREDWIDGNVTFQDLWELQGDDCKITFQMVEDKQWLDK